MSEMSRYLRYLINGDKEAIVTPFEVTDTPTEFTSQLSEGYSRKMLAFYNNSHADSGEVYYGYSATLATTNGHPIPLGARVSVPVSTDISVYLVSASGEKGDIRAEEVS